MGNSLGSRANYIYSHGSDKLTEVQLNISTSDIEKPFLFSDLKSEDEKAFSAPEKARISSRVNTCY